MAFLGVLEHDVGYAFKGTLEAETEAPTDSDSGFDSDAVGASKALDLDKGLSVGFLQTDSPVPHRFVGLEPLRVLVAGESSQQAFPRGEPAKLFGFNHLAPGYVQPLALQSGCCVTIPSVSPAFQVIGSSKPSPTCVQVTHHASSRGTTSVMCIQWTVDARKLNSKDNVIVSPSFDLPLVQPTPFKIMLQPKQLSSRKGGQCFQKCRGVGTVLLKCEVGVPEGAANLTVKSSVGKERFARHQEHDFSQCGVCSMPHVWNFCQAVDANTRSFIVKLEVSPTLRLCGDGQSAFFKS
jgi:hypothetical protein